MNDRNERKELFDLDSLLHPAQAFGHPSEVLNDPDLTLNEKRAILASWASDACGIEAAPELRGSAKGQPVRFDDIMDALKALDKHAGEGAPVHYRRLLRRRTILDRGGSHDQSNHGPLLN